MTYDSALIWNGNHQVAIRTQLALTSQSAVVLWITRPINILLFAIAHVWQN
jgi:hypothetical protein